MPASPIADSARDRSADLEARLAQVEATLAALGTALRARDPSSIDRHAAELQVALAQAVEQFSKAARTGPVPPRLRSRLASASGQVAAQRESLARATAALDRAIDVLLPPSSGGLYSNLGSADRRLGSGTVQA